MARLFEVNELDGNDFTQVQWDNINLVMETLRDHCYSAHSVKLFGDKDLYVDAWVSGGARVSGNAHVSGKARVSE